MDSSVRLFGRQSTVYEILGGGITADVILWRRRDVTMGIFLGTLAAWMVFEVSGYTLLSLISNVLLLLASILFMWAKAAEILNRPSPPIPELHLSEEFINTAAVFVRCQVNRVLSISRDIALGKDPKLFYKVAACLWVTSVVGCWTDFLTLAYTSLAVLLTVPVLYEKYEDNVDRYAMMAVVKLEVYQKIHSKYFSKAKMWILEKRKLL